MQSRAGSIHRGEHFRQGLWVDRAGLRELLDRHGYSLPEDAIFEGDFKFESGIQGARQILLKHPEITAIWAQNDLMAVGALKFFVKTGKTVPQDISLMGMDDIGLARLISPALTTVSQPFEEICEKAVELLLSQKQDNGSSARKIVVDPGVVIRESTAAI